MYEGENMNKFYQKNELGFAIFWIVLYVVGASVADMLSELIGINKIITFIYLLALSIVLLIWIFKNNLKDKYGLCKPTHNSKQFLYYIPLVVLISVNLWCGVSLNVSITEMIFYILTMFCVGFVEEIIFRGLLFRAMEKDNIKTAIIVSSLTFGIGHIINLFVGSDMSLIANICQICYAIAIGFLFVIMFYRGKSLIACIVTHSIFNALSVFQNASSGLVDILISLILIIVPTIYAVILLKTLPLDNNNTQKSDN